MSETREKLVQALLKRIRDGEFDAVALREAWDAGRLSGAEEERAAVVEWLKEQLRLVEADPVNDAAKKSGLLYWRQIAEAIEQGAHRKAGKP